MANTYANDSNMAAAELNFSPDKSRGGVLKKQPRDESLKMPRKNSSRQHTLDSSCQQASTETSRKRCLLMPSVPPPSPRESFESSQGPDSPKTIVDTQASTGADKTRRNGKAWQAYGSRKMSHDTSRQSEMSNVLNCYLRNQSPLPKMALLQTPCASSKSSTNTAFGCGLDPPKPTRRSSRPQPTNPSPPVLDICWSSDKALPPLPLQQTCTYTLFPSSTRTPGVDQGNRTLNLRSNNNNSDNNNILPLQSTTLPLRDSIDHQRPRKVSLPSSVRSRADSCTSTRLLSSIDVRNPGTNMDSTLSSNTPKRPSPIRVSSYTPTSPPSIRSSSRLSMSIVAKRWSSDSIATASPASKRISSAPTSLASPEWPATGSFFEDDDDDDEEELDERVPLRQKVVTKFRSVRARSSSFASTAVDGDEEKMKSGWMRRFVSCCANGRG